MRPMIVVAIGGRVLHLPCTIMLLGMMLGGVVLFVAISYHLWKLFCGADEGVELPGNHGT